MTFTITHVLVSNPEHDSYLDIVPVPTCDSCGNVSHGDFGECMG